MKRFLISVLVLAPVAPLRAEPEPTSPLTLSAALERAGGHNPALAALRFRERAGDGLVEQAGLRPNPTLDVTFENFLGTGPVQGVRRLESTVQASQTLERGGKRGKRMALAERERDIAVQEFTVNRTEVLAATAIAFATTLAAQQRLELAGEALQLAHETLAAVHAPVQAGAASPAESARARAAIALAKADQARGRSALAVARAALAATWGGAATDFGSLSGRIQLPATMPPGDGFLATIDQHPRLELQAALVARRRAALELEVAQAVSDVTVGGGVRFLREGTDATFVAGVSLPIRFRHKNQGNIRAAREMLAEAEQTLRAVETELRIAFAIAWEELNAVHTAALSLRHDALPAIAEAHAISSRSYAVGEQPLTDVLDAQRALVALRREILEAESAFAVALARVEGLTASTFATTAELFLTE